MQIIAPRSDPDILGNKLASLGRLARSMPCSWDGARDTCLIAGPQGEYIGKVLPGRGIMLSDDLKNVGIVRAIPHIYERSLTRWLWDKLRDERGAITTYDDLLTAKRTYKHETNPRGNKQTFPSTSNIWSCSH